jgi:hypothetical protein
VFVVVGAVIFRQLDEAIAEEPWQEVILFTFTTITTIGRAVP